MTDPVEFFESKPWTAGVIGLGYVGLPLLVTAAKSGLGVVGFDSSIETVSGLISGRSHIDDVSDGEVSTLLEAGAEISNDPGVLKGADAIFICVPSPLGTHREPDLSYIEAAAKTVEEVAKPGQLVCLESTTYPGTTDDFLVPVVKRAGLEIDLDVWVAYSPERVSPGDDLKTGEIPKVVGGVTPLSGDVAAAAYRRIVPSVHQVSSASAAEMAKLLENTYRAVNIGLVNEVAQLSHELGIDVWEVIDAAATKPFGYQAFYPGPGVGGHCIPLDPQYLAWRARGADFATKFIETADEINRGMPKYVIRRVTDLLNDSGKSIRGSKILALGVAYKAGVSDDRESASLEVVRRLSDLGAEVSVFDRHVDGERLRTRGFDVVEDSGPGFDVAIVLTDHPDVDYSQIADEVPFVFDTRGIYRRYGITAANIHSL